MSNSEIELVAVHDAVQAALARIRRDHFADRMKLTFVARDPNNPACYFVVSDDPGQAAILGALKSAPVPGTEGGA